MTGSLDRITLHKIFGPLFFLGVMYAMFAFAINLGGMVQGWVNDASTAIFVTGFSAVLKSVALPEWLINIFAHGIGRGINITLTFVPVLGAIFLSLGILEGTGYMLRAAYIVDRLMRMVGLSGKSFVPLIVGFGCNVPAIMGARSITNQRERILTIMMTPFMSCGARLAIYAIFVAAFFPTGGQNVIFSLYLIGVLAAILTGFILRPSVRNNIPPMSLTDMPAYRWPDFYKLLRHTWNRIYDFVVDAGSMIIIMSIIINGVGINFLASIGKFITPIFGPIGITPENWPATLGLLTGMVGKEAVIGALNSYYHSQQMLITSFGSATAAYAYLLFTLLYFPCISVVATIAKELNLKWAAFSVVWSTGLAYMIAALFYQLATMQASGQSLVWICGLLCTLSVFMLVARKLTRDNDKYVPTPINLVS